MKTATRLTLVLALFAGPLYGRPEGITADRVVALADAVRNPQEDYQVTTCGYVLQPCIENFCQWRLREIIL